MHWALLSLGRRAALRPVTARRVLAAALVVPLLASADVAPAATATTVVPAANSGLAATSAPTAAADWESYWGWKVGSFDITGLEPSMKEQLEKGLALARTGLLKKEQQIFFPEKLEEDVQRARLFLARRGYPRATVAPEVQPRGKGEELAVLLRIDPGPAVVAAAVSADSLPPALAKEATRITIVPGDVLVDSEVETSAQALASRLQERGYARARVASHLEWLDSTRVHLHFEAHPGAVSYFGGVRIEGASPDLEGLAGKTTGIERGERYAPQALDDARENLRTLNLFQQTRVEIVDTASDTVDVVVSLVERRPTYLQASLRYWSDDEIQGMARWTNRNLFGGGKGVSAGASISPFLQKADVSTWWPALTGPRTTGITTLRAERESEDSYTSVTSGALLTLRYNRSFATHVLLGLDVSNVQVTETVVGASPGPIQDGLLTALRFEASRRATDDPVSATRGHSVGFSSEWAPDDLGSDNSYYLAGAGATVYIPIMKRTQVACRALFALGAPTGSSEVLLPNKRYYSGGAASHRGFERRELGPLDASGAPYGGEAKLESSLELRFPLFWRFRAAAFIDVGQVWPTLEEIGYRSLEVAVGPGLWLQTPIGPLRGDYGIRITDYNPTQPERVFHFTIGPAF